MTTVVAPGLLGWKGSCALAAAASAASQSHTLPHIHTFSFSPGPRENMQRPGQRDVCQHHGQGGEQWKLHAKQARARSTQSTTSKKKRNRVWGAQTPGTETPSPRLASSLPLISLSALAQLSEDDSQLCIWNHQNQSPTPFVSLSTFSLAETNKGSTNPAANVLLLDGLSHRDRKLLGLVTTPV